MAVALSTLSTFATLAMLATLTTTPTTTRTYTYCTYTYYTYCITFSTPTMQTDLGLGRLSQLLWLDYFNVLQVISRNQQ